ncbi:PAS domain-containing sensor histidine kinase [Mucilaginibacter panaciglaebae]|uniref:histidine kinase n=1 Tax=Mucilaginibacter panaciglaebae TaxID=502331 RepID=A0ABP7X3Y2_9SPHI
MNEYANTPDTEFNLELFFDLSADLLCIAGYDGYFRKINPAVSNMLGYTREELFSRPISDFIHPDDKSATAANRNNLTQSSIPLLNFENRYITKSGETVWLSWTSMPVDSEQLVYAIAKNITHKKKQEEDRNLLIKNLTDLNNDLKKLNYTTSHDLRAPVANLLAVFDLLDNTKITDNETQEFIHHLKAATNNLKNTLDRYVDALVEKATPQIDMRELDLNKTLDNVLRSLSSLVNGSRATIEVDFSKLSQIRFNETQLESVFLNLITNAIKYAKPGEAPYISISSQQVNGINQVTFADKGIGFDMNKVKDRLFGFHQKFHDNSDGKGIGLYLVYNHITGLGGNITVESKVNEGTVFTISFNRPTGQEVLFKA